EKPNPYRLLALADQKLGRCADAAREADRFLSLAPLGDSRRGEVASIRESCTPPSAPAASPAPRTASPPPQKPTTLWRNAAIASVVVGSVGVIVGVPLLVFVDDKAAGAVPTALGAAGLLVTIPFFVVDFDVR